MSRDQSALDSSLTGPYEIDLGFALKPELVGLAGDETGVTEERFSFEDTYYDTASAGLLQLDVTLRRRIGEPSAGWQLATPEGEPHRVPADPADAAAIPTGLTGSLTGLSAGEELAAVAHLTTTRTVHRVMRKGRLVEVVDDQVSATTMGTQARLSRWRELTVLGDQRMVKKLVGRLHDHQARQLEPDSRLTRVLGDDGPTDHLDADPLTVGDLASAYVAAQCAEIVRCDLGLRMDEPLVHKFRVAIRRLRSTLRVFSRVFDAEASAALETELVWLAGLLGEVRDRDVLLERLLAQVRALPPEMVLGPVANRIETTLLLERSEHQTRLTEAMGSKRYFALVTSLRTWLHQPPLTPYASQPAAKVDRYLRRAEHKVHDRIAHADGDVEALHRGRKAAKRYRYAAELSAPAVGKKAAKTVEAQTELQTLLGEHQDSVVSAAFLRRMGAAAAASRDQNGFTYGLLLAQEWERAERVRIEAAERWGKKGR